MNRRVRIKPGKGQSMTGFFGGIIFCFIGLFVVIPAAGGFGVLWTLFALVITIINGYNAFTDKGIASHEITIDEEESDIFTPAENKKPAEERLKEVQGLYDRGIITYDEYQMKRKQILEEL